MEDYTWVGFFAPAGTPAEVAQKLNDALLNAARDPANQGAAGGARVRSDRGPLADTAYVKSELAKWGKVVRDVGAKID